MMRFEILTQRAATNSFHSKGANWPALAILCAASWMAARGATFTVTTVADSGAGSLRQAILNVNAGSGSNSIIFNLTGTKPFTITPATPLQGVSNVVLIDGTTQPGFSNGPVIALCGTNAGSGAVGLQLTAGFSTVRGLAVNGFNGEGLILLGASNVIQGNFIGTDVNGMVAQGNGSKGIWVKSPGNFIGGTNAGNGNVVSGNGDDGIYLNFNGPGNTIQGNFIGVGAGGASALGNHGYGIVVKGSGANWIGGTNSGARNVISGNSSSGVYVTDAGAAGNSILGNYIGTDFSGGVIVSNAGDGITLISAPGNVIGYNLISGNSLDGLSLYNNGASGNAIFGNRIGTDATGKNSLSNRVAGIYISGAVGNQIGGTNAGSGNLISGNAQDGVYLTGGASGNSVQGNFIGLDTTGTNALHNGYNGISISGAVSNLIGGSVSAARNVISGNANNGIEIYLPTDTGNAICGNYIGTGIAGATAVGNTWHGIFIQGCSNIVGGATTGSGNVISGNGDVGVLLLGNNGNVTGNIIQGNIIGLDTTGANNLGNGDAGVGIDGAANNQVGGTTVGTRNIISANGAEGIYFIDPGATNNVIEGNYIGTDQTGMIGRGNSAVGINLQGTGFNRIGGSAPGAWNLISANGSSLYNGGIYLASPWNVVQGNFIGTTTNGVGALGNFGHGIDLQPNATNNVIGGIVPGAGNRIAFAQDSLRCGVRVRTGAFNNLISGNAIFSNGALGIDLDPTTGGSGSGTNPIVHCESGVAASAANRGQNYPVLTNVVSGGGTRIRGWLDGTQGKSYTLQFFSSPVGDPSGYGEGQVYLGQTVLTLGASSCVSNFSAVLPASVPAGWVVTATATDTNNNTSEFSAWTNVVIVPQVQAGAANQTNHLFSLSWTNNGWNYVLQQTYNLASPQQWTPVTSNPSLSNGFFVLTLSATNAETFYRLSAQ